MLSTYPAEKLFKDVTTSKVSGLNLVRGDDPYLNREFFDLVKASGFELYRFELKSSGPDANVESAALGMGLFAQKTLVWIRAKDSPSKWTKDSLARWSSLKNNADGETLMIVMQVSDDRRIKWDHLEISHHVNWSSAEQNQLPWLQRMIKKREWDACPKRIDFLLKLGFELIELDTAVELWSLGGDLWAEKSLGWSAEQSTQHKSVRAFSGGNMAFDWVDSVIEGRKKDALELLRLLIKEQGAEPLQLTALLSKSVRLVSTLHRGWNTKEYPEFLIKKWKSKRIAKGRVDMLLELLQRTDIRLKSTSSDALANLQQISAI